MDGALLMSNFVEIRCFMLELRKCTDYIKVYLCNAVLVTELRRYFVIDNQQLITSLINNVFERNLVAFS